MNKQLKLHKLIYDRYNNAEELIKVAKKYELEDVLNKAIEEIETSIQKNKTDGIISLSGLILSKVNAQLQLISDDAEKQKIKYLLGDLFQEYLDIIASQQNGIDRLTEIQKHLQAVCAFEGYDYKDLSNYLRIEKHQVLFPKGSSRNIYYEWNGKIYELDGLAGDIYDKKIISSVKEFKKLFKPITGNLVVQCNIEKVSSLLILFQVLKEYCLITTRGGSGHFAPLVKYSVDNDGQFLFKKAANKIHERLKRKAAEYIEVKEKMVNLVLANASDTIGQ